ncbi:MMPL family transporter [Planctomonas sp. JC2975]|uniref:MMPL family transporter n=1 Tax=Planctomonas sp. JC2975 TaxID=2729626 RepID=UPI0014759773|nr:MMPL family transporter [Planctomonas sp. JC2975]NNC12442.1 MMPL family transporter [Planctomonas sp. JC2975]
MSSFLYAVGRWAFRRRSWVLTIWLALVALAIAGAALLGTGTQNTYAIPGTESQQALDALARTFPQMSGASAQLVAVAPAGASVRDPAFQSAVEESVTRLSRIPQVSSATSPYSSTSTANISSDESAVIVPVQLSVAQSAVSDATDAALQTEAHHLESQLPKGSQTAMGGQLFAQTSTGISITELLGIAVAFVVLAFTFVSLLAAAMPLITALLGVAVSLSVILAMTSVTTITSTTPLLALMLGLAVGIDYGLFIASRHRDQVRSGIDPEESAARAIATAGSAVVFAAVTVIIALLGLSVAGIPFLTTMGVASAGAVALAVLISMTLMPALLGFLGWRIVPKALRPGAAGRTPHGRRHVNEGTGHSAQASGASAHEAASEGSAAVTPDAGSDAGTITDATTRDPSPSASGPADGQDDDVEKDGSGATPDRVAARPSRLFLGWVRGATRWPIVTVVVIVAALGLLAVPASHLRLALPDAGSLPAGEPGRVTYDLIDKHFGPGYNGPLIMTGSVIQSKDPVGLMNDLGASIAKVPGVVAVPLSTPNQSGDTGIVQVIPSGAPDSQATEDLVGRLRGMHDEFQKQYGVDLSVTGYTAAGIDVSERLAQALLPFGILVVGLSLVLLAMVFRSIVVPVTAALGYLLSIGAAFGITSLVFMDGWLSGPLGVASLGSVISFMPIILMGVLFGLAMDYEVFLVSRMREDYVHHGDAHGAVEAGFLGSAKVVTAAAVIMFAVFAAFVPEGDASIQPIALGLAVGVAIDAFIVRMTLIPAVLRLFGRFAWWMPAGLDRMLPHFDAEGEGIAHELELADWPADGSAYAIAAENVAVARSGREIASGLDVLVPYGDVLLVRADDDLAGAIVVAAICGRGDVASGRLKVAGFVLPTRAGAVRARSAIVPLRGSSAPADEVDLALRDGIAVLGLCDPDSVGDERDRNAIAEVLERERAERLRSGAPPLTVVASVGVDADVAELMGQSVTTHSAMVEATAPASTDERMASEVS